MDLVETVKQLSWEDFRTYALPLRLRILRDEKAWTNHPVSDPGEMEDRYDPKAIHFGVMDLNRCVAAIRLIIADKVDAHITASHLGALFHRKLGAGEAE